MLYAMLAQPVIVRVIETPAKSTSVGDVLIGAIGLTGVLILVAVLLGAALGGLLIGVKKFRARYNLEPIPDEEFQPALIQSFQLENPGALPKGYTRRFLNANDGTGGRMSVRWGMKGPKGTNSSGLN